MKNVIIAVGFILAFILVWFLPDFTESSDPLGGFSNQRGSTSAIGGMSQTDLEELVMESKLDYNNQFVKQNNKQTQHASKLVLTERDLYFERMNKEFHVGSLKGLCVLRDIVNGVNEVDVLGYFPLQDDVKSYMRVVLEADIDMASLSNWIPFDSFAGVFDGRHYTISNLRCVGSGYHGLFRGFGQHGNRRSLIMNLDIQDAFVHEPNRCGVFAGTMVNSMVRNCRYIDSAYKAERISVEASARGGEAGGIAGRVEDVVALHCGVMGNVKEHQAYSGPFGGEMKNSVFVGCYTVSKNKAIKTEHPFGGFAPEGHNIFVGCVVLYDKYGGLRAVDGNELWKYHVEDTNNMMLNCYGGADISTCVVPYLKEINKVCADWFKVHGALMQKVQLTARGAKLEFEKLNLK